MPLSPCQVCLCLPRLPRLPTYEESSRPPVHLSSLSLSLSLPDLPSPPIPLHRHDYPTGHITSNDLTEPPCEYQCSPVVVVPLLLRRFSSRHHLVSLRRSSSSPTQQAPQGSHLTKGVLHRLSPFLNLHRIPQSSGLTSPRNTRSCVCLVVCCLIAPSRRLGHCDSSVQQHSIAFAIGNKSQQFLRSVPSRTAT